MRDTDDSLYMSNERGKARYELTRHGDSYVGQGQDQPCALTTRLEKLDVPRACPGIMIRHADIKWRLHVYYYVLSIHDLLTKIGQQNSSSAKR